MIVVLEREVMASAQQQVKSSSPGVDPHSVRDPSWSFRTGILCAEVSLTHHPMIKSY